MKLPEYTAIVQQFYTERLKYLTPILSALARSNHPPKEIIVWHNCLEYEVERQIRVEQIVIPVRRIKSGSNIVIGRYLAAMTANTDYVLVQDDDLVVEKRLTERLMQTEVYADKFQVGHEGRVFGEKYTDGKGVHAGREPRYANVVSRVWMAHKRALVAGMELIASGELGNINEYPLMRCDDMIFSLANGGAWVAAEMKDGGIENLDEEGIGMSHDERHMKERDEGAEIILKAIKETRE